MKNAFTGGRTSLTLSKIRGIRAHYKSCRNIKTCAKRYKVSYHVARNVIKKITYRKVR